MSRTIALDAWTLTGYKPGSDLPETPPLPVTLPCRVGGALLAAGLIGDPAIGLASRDAAWITLYDWVLETRQAMPDEQYVEKTFLILEGVSGTGEVFINGCSVAQIAGASATVDVTGVIQKENHILVRFRAGSAPVAPPLLLSPVGVESICLKTVSGLLIQQAAVLPREDGVSALLLSAAAEVHIGGRYMLRVRVLDGEELVASLDEEHTLAPTRHELAAELILQDPLAGTPHRGYEVRIALDRGTIRADSAVRTAHFHKPPPHRFAAVRLRPDPFGRHEAALRGLWHLKAAGFSAVAAPLPRVLADACEELGLLLLDAPDAAYSAPGSAAFEGLLGASLGNPGPHTPEHPVWRHAGFSQERSAELDAAFGPVNDLRAWTRLARWVQAERLRESVSRSRTEAWWADEALDALPSPGAVGLLETDGTPKPTLFAVAEGFSPCGVECVLERTVLLPGEVLRGEILVRGADESLPVRVEAVGVGGEALGAWPFITPRSAEPVLVGRIELPIPYGVPAFVIRVLVGDAESPWARVTRTVVVPEQGEAPLRPLTRLPSALVRLAAEGPPAFINDGPVAALGVTIIARGASFWPGRVDLLPWERVPITAALMASVPLQDPTLEWINP